MYEMDLHGKSGGKTSRAVSPELTTRVPITVAIIARNEERNLARCLKSLCWADEILVVDGGSTDRTTELCEDRLQPWAEAIRLVRREWTGFRDQRDFAVREARHDWILVVDADEECSAPLAHKIRELMGLPEGPPYRAYKVRREEYFLGKVIRHGIWNPSYQDRFFHRRGVKYTGDIHEYPLFPQAPQNLHEPLFHSPEFSPEKFLKKMNEYTTLEARARVQSGQRTNAFILITAFPAMFLKNYFYYGAWRDGMHGFIISLLEGISRVVRHVKIWQFTRELENQK